MHQTLRVFSPPHPRPAMLYLLAAAGASLVILLSLRLDFTHPSSIGFLAMGLLGPTMAAVDIRELRLPDFLTATTGIAAVVGSAITCLITTEWSVMITALIVAFAAAGTLYVVSLITGGGIGLGDIKILAVIGFIVGAFGWQTLAYCLAAAFITGAIAAIITLLTPERAREIPFGPFLIGATIITGFLAPAGS